jgi:hypothetical protein
MPIVTEDSQPKQRRAPWWVLGLVLVALLPVGLFGWSLHRPVSITMGSSKLRLGTLPLLFVYNGASPPRAGNASVPLPLGFGTYYIAWESYSD